MIRRLQALAFLGWRFSLHFVKLLSPFHKRPGLEQYRKNYTSEGLTTVSATERERFTGFEKCIACDLCLHAWFTEGGRRYDPRAATPRDLALCLSRSMPDYPSARAIVDGWTGMEGFEKICPRGVDLPGIVELMRHHIAAYDEATGK